MSIKYTLNTIIDEWIQPYVDIIIITLQLQFKPEFLTENGLSIEHYEHTLIGNTLSTWGHTSKLSKEKLQWLSNYYEWKAYYRELQKPMNRKDLREFLNRLVDLGILEISSIIKCNNNDKKCNYWTRNYIEKVDRCPKCNFTISIKELNPPLYLITRNTAKKIEKIITGCIEKYKVIDGSEDYLRMVQRQDKERSVSYSEVLERIKQIKDYLKLKKTKDKEKSNQ